MKIKRARFFQSVEIPDHRTDNHNVGTHITDEKHDVELQGNLIKITHRETKNTVYVTIFNTSYLRVADVESDTKPAPSAKVNNKAKQD